MGSIPFVLCLGYKLDCVKLGECTFLFVGGSLVVGISGDVCDTFANRASGTVGQCSSRRWLRVIRHILFGLVVLRKCFVVRLYIDGL